MADRKHQPLCADCGHPRSFHRDGTSCWALGCDCEDWLEMPAEQEAEPTPV